MVLVGSIKKRLNRPRIDCFKGRAKPNRLRYYDSAGKRVSAFFALPDEALRFAEEIKGEAPPELSVSIAERMALYRLREIGRARNIASEKLIELAIQAAKEYTPGIGKPIAKARDEFIADCKRLKLRPLSVVFTRGA